VSLGSPGDELHAGLQIDGGRVDDQVVELRVARVGPAEAAHVGIPAAVGLLHALFGSVAIDALKPHRLLQACLPGAVQAYMQGPRVSPQDHGTGAAEDDPAPAVRPLEDGSLGHVADGPIARGLGGGRAAVGLADRRQVHQQACQEMARRHVVARGCSGQARGDIGVDQPVHERHVQTFRELRRDLATTSAV
jgi:hypothetical protein